MQRFGNPLLLRRPLDHGVRVIVAHCASLGHGVDLDRARRGQRASNFALFARLMDDPRYEGRLLGDISGVTQSNRFPVALRQIIERREWHARLLNGSDYPLPGLVPLLSLRRLVEHGFLDGGEATVLSALRGHNPLLFDFVLKRTVRWRGKRIGEATFHTRHAFERRRA